MSRKFNRHLSHILFDSMDTSDSLFILSDGLYQRERLDDNEYNVPSSKNIIYSQDRLSYLYKTNNVTLPQPTFIYYLFNKKVFIDPSVTLHDLIFILAPYRHHLTNIHDKLSTFLNYYENNHKKYNYKKLERRILSVEHRVTIHEYDLKSYYDEYTAVYINGSATIYLSDIIDLLNCTIKLNNNFNINYFACPPNLLDDIIYNTVSIYSNLVIEYTLFDVIKALFSDLTYEYML